MMKNSFLIFLVFSSCFVVSQKSEEVSFLFMGDIMGHGPQIRSAWQESSKEYDYDEVFKPLKELISSVDFAVANLEVTLAGKPYDGYPQFSSPDNLAVACKENGIDVLVTANNHSCDRGSKGVIKTVKTLDKLSILHTGTFSDDKKRDSLNLLILSKNGIKVGLLNYTYGTNGMPFASPSYVNLLDSALIKKDVLKAKENEIDKLIVFVHWGAEYKDFPNQYQKQYNQYFKELGVDVVIGSHPHVIQPMIYENDSTNNTEFLTAYSLGNFVSNQRERRKDGGVMLRLSFSKTKKEIKISNKEYLLTWVHKFKEAGKNHYQILPCTHPLYSKSYFSNEKDFEAMNTFIKDSRKHLNQNNIDVKEGSPYPRIRIEPHPPEKIKLNIKKRKVMLLNREKTKKRKVKPN
jgi:poly-gamma-glutamate capsule biosynthesis protein CapA/YwtB (metallophosphatase superfamily)